MMTPMRFLLSFSSLLLVASLSARAQDDVPDLSAYAGRYEGFVLNGGDMEPITTTLRVVGEGRLVGDYLIRDDEEGDKPGNISNVFLDAPGLLTLQWTDKDGEGFAELQFTDDFRSFDGGWGTFDTPPTNPWNGRKR